MTPKLRGSYRFVDADCGTVPVTSDDVQETEETLQRAVQFGVLPPPWSTDLLHIARMVFVADKRCDRRKAPDRWTRTIDLEVELIDPAPWRDRAGRIVLELLTVLTGDRWRLDFRQTNESFEVQMGLFDEPVSEVVLFSGGLDSTAYGSKRSREREPLLFVTYQDFHLYELQRRRLEKMSGGDGTRYVTTSQRVQEVQEWSSRSRGFLYVATAIWAATARGASRVCIPENGQLAVNPPLTPSRLGSCSTRSVHPYTLHLLNELIACLGEQDLTVENPLWSMTKGEVCELALQSGLSAEELAEETYSCGSHPANTGGRDEHCGACVPCLLRRSGLHASSGGDRTRYKEPPERVRQHENVRALEWWLNHEFGERDIVADMPLPPGLSARSLLPVLERGRIEYRTMLASL
ncbi:hypothetical protein GCM10023108_40960 [Saccharopolyspora hordei]